MPGLSSEPATFRALSGCCLRHVNLTNGQAAHTVPPSSLFICKSFFQAPILLVEESSTSSRTLLFGLESPGERGTSVEKCLY